MTILSSPLWQSCFLIKQIFITSVLKPVCICIGLLILQLYYNKCFVFFVLDAFSKNNLMQNEQKYLSLVWIKINKTTARRSGLNFFVSTWIKQDVGNYVPRSSTRHEKIRHHIKNIKSLITNKNFNRRYLSKTIKILLYVCSNYLLKWQIRGKQTTKLYRNVCYDV